MVRIVEGHETLDKSHLWSSNVARRLCCFESRSDTDIETLYKGSRTTFGVRTVFGGLY